MECRRKNLEDKQKALELKKQEDLEREIKQKKLKERVSQSRYLVDNSKQLEEQRKNKQIEFKENLRNLKVEYLQELEKRKQKVYNKPLMFEQDMSNSTVNKLNKFKNTMIAVEECVDNEEEEYCDNNNNNNNNNINNNNNYTENFNETNTEKLIDNNFLSS